MRQFIDFVNISTHGSNTQREHIQMWHSTVGANTKLNTKPGDGMFLPLAGVN